VKKLGIRIDWPFHSGSKLPVLLNVRWIGQCGDGIFQSALASFILFSPERQPDAISAAAAFAMVLLPYSLFGPFVGNFLDKFSRQKIVQYANALRVLDLIAISVCIKFGQLGVALTVLVLVAFGINRLILAGLSAGLPLIVRKDELISANALAVTGGSLCVVIGGGIGFGIKKVLDSQGRSDLSDAKVIVLASLCYLASAIISTRLGRSAIGPVIHADGGKASGSKEIQEGLRILREHPDALRGIIATAAQRGGLTALTLMGLLLERNTYNPVSNPDAGLSGFAYALGIAGVGIGIGSIMTPFFVSYFGRHRWIRIMMSTPIFLLFLFAFSHQEWLLISTAFFVGMCGQAVKVTNDALVQSQIADEYRGRVFAFYDIAVNGAIVTGAVVAAITLPASGISVLLPFITILIYGSTSLVLLRRSKFFIARPI
jgi:MFS family permease